MRLNEHPMWPYVARAVDDSGQGAKLDKLGAVELDKILWQSKQVTCVTSDVWREFNLDQLFDWSNVAHYSGVQMVHCTRAELGDIEPLDIEVRQAELFSAEEVSS